jgi:TonB family protein
MFTILATLLTLSPSPSRIDNINPTETFARDPSLIWLAEPEYPDLAFDLRIEGAAIVLVHLDESGKPLAGHVTRSSSILFEEAALESAMKSRYSPAIGIGGEPVPSMVKVPFTFRIR